MTSASPEVHPAADLFPMLDESALQELAADIKTNGLVHPVVLYQGKVLDGRNRLAACKLAGVAPTFSTWDGPSPTAYVMSANLKRRHLAPSERVQLAIDAEALFKEEAAARMREGQKKGAEVANSGGRSRDEVTLERKAKQDDSRRALAQAAKAAGAGLSSAKKLKSAERRAPEIAPLVRSGKANVAEAVRVAEMSPRERHDVLTLTKNGVNVREAIETVKQGMPEPDFGTELEDIAEKMRKHSKALFGHAESLGTILRQKSIRMSSPAFLTMKSMLVAARGSIDQALKIMEGT